MCLTNEIGKPQCRNPSALREDGGAAGKALVGVVESVSPMWPKRQATSHKASNVCMVLSGSTSTVVATWTFWLRMPRCMSNLWLKVSENQMWEGRTGQSEGAVETRSKPFEADCTAAFHVCLVKLTTLIAHHSLHGSRSSSMEDRLQ